MRTVQMTLDEDLVNAVDKAARKLKTTRSAFARDALRAALKKFAVLEKERRHKESYLKHPEDPDEGEVWASQTVWPDDDDFSSWK